MPLYIEKINGDVNGQGEYRAICLFRKLENRQKGTDLQLLGFCTTHLPNNHFVVDSDKNDDDGA